MISQPEIKDRLLVGSIEEIRRVVRHTDLVTPPPRKRLRDLLNEIPTGDEE